VFFITILSIMSASDPYHISPELKEALGRKAMLEGKSIQQVAEHILADYTQRQQICLNIDDLWFRTGQKLKDKGFQHRDIDAIIQKVRKV